MAAPMKPADVAARWNCSPGHIRRLCRTEQLTAMRLGSDWRISLEAVEAYEAAHTTAPAVETVKPARAATSPAALTLVPADMDGALPDRWWENPTLIPVSSAGARGRSATKKKAGSQR